MVEITYSQKHVQFCMHQSKGVETRVAGGFDAHWAGSGERNFLNFQVKNTGFYHAFYCQKKLHTCGQKPGQRGLNQRSTPPPLVGANDV